MKRRVLATVALATTLLIAGCAPQHYVHRSRQAPAAWDSLSQMTKQDIISLSKAGVSDSLIVTMLDVSGSFPVLTPQDVIDLKAAGVGERVIGAMLAAKPEEGEEHVSRGYYYPPDYWVGAFPYWYFWYPTWYWDAPFRYYRPLHLYTYGFPRRPAFAPGGFRGGGSVGWRTRGGGRHR